ncbi:esterase/lipase family protein [Microbacterium thalassium]|uniref:GPI inositol-deacylase PGAP1-like alpha/beta domain-containing protein n=1 Tax=Microbacterium thalassium TaxID=362649 RepID=A0A7X0FMG9_9MICO|nr:alpha/beta fold hydrolase [Microbacterium thalassium]MBB6390204.1 hypothetical protein [Microbacterium thalassium]
MTSTMLGLPPAAVAESGCPQPQGNLAGKNVAVLVHGWLGTEMTDAEPILQSALGSDWRVVTFDYKALNTLWPSSSTVIDCLRLYARNAQTLTGKTVPSIYFAGHSMGGLMARFSFEPNSEDADVVGGVVTIDTPHAGSPWGASMLGQFYQASQNWTGGGDAAKCLALHHPGALPSGCGYPPALADNVPIAQVAGNATLTRTYFMTGRQEVDIMSDGIVWLDSQVGYARSLDTAPTNAVEGSYVVRCDYGWGPAVATASTLFSGIGSASTASYRWWTGETFNLIQSGSPTITADKNAIAVLAALGSQASCGHTKIKTNPEALSAVAGYLKDWAAAANRWVITGDGIGPVQRNSTLDELRENLDIDYLDVCYWVQKAEPIGTKHDTWNMFVWDQGTSSGRYDLLIVRSKFDDAGAPIFGADAPMLANGISLGSSSAELRAAGINDDGYGDPLGGPASLFWSYPDRGVNILIETFNDRVTQIAVGTDFLYGEWCS